MKFISHRGNLTGKTNLENHPTYIENAIKAGFDVEIDLRVKYGIPYLGHDCPQYQITSNWIFSKWNRLWIHCKDLESIKYMYSLIDNDFESWSWQQYNFFMHEDDDFTFTSQRYLWTYSGVEFDNLPAVCVLPERFLSMNDVKELKNYTKNACGICSDYILNIKNMFVNDVADDGEERI